MNITYKTLSSSHLDKYRAIRLECLKNYPQNFGSLYEDELQSTQLKFDKIITEDNGTDFLYGAFDEENLVGICGCIQEKRTKTKHIAEISQMYVSPTYNGKGIATKLMENVMEKAFSNNDTEQIILAVSNSNDAAIHLYKKLGFVQYGFLENYMKYEGNYVSQVFMALKRKV
jgi:ribosomal protein S18 acetylase RimI-like enzyme